MSRDFVVGFIHGLNISRFLDIYKRTKTDLSGGWPSIRTKAWSRRSSALQRLRTAWLPEQGGGPRLWKSRRESLLGGSFHQPSIRPVTSAMILLCESRSRIRRSGSGRERPINFAV